MCVKRLSEVVRHLIPADPEAKKIPHSLGRTGSGRSTWGGQQLEGRKRPAAGSPVLPPLVERVGAQLGWEALGGILLPQGEGPCLAWSLGSPPWRVLRAGEAAAPCLQNSDCEPFVLQSTCHTWPRAQGPEVTWCVSTPPAGGGNCSRGRAEGICPRSAKPFQVALRRTLLRLTKPVFLGVGWAHSGAHWLLGAVCVPVTSALCPAFSPGIPAQPCRWRGRLRPRPAPLALTGSLSWPISCRPWAVTGYG